MQDQRPSSPADDPEAVRAAAAGVLAEMVGVQSTTMALRSRWLALGSAYHAPEAGAVVSAMDQPRDEVSKALDSVRGLTVALTAYADRLQEIHVWSQAPGTDPAAVSGARQQAEQACAAAIAALIGSHHRTCEALAGVAPSASASFDASAAWAPRTDPDRIARGGSTASFGVAPPTDGDAIEHGFSAAEMLGLAASTHASWMVSVEHGVFRPRASSGRFVAAATLTPAQRLRAGAGRVSTAEGLSRYDRLRTFEPSGNIVAKGHRRAAHARWSRTSTVLGRANTGLSLASTGWSTWQGSAGEATDGRIGRTATRTATSAGGAWAGGQAGAWVGAAVGTAVLPGAGTVLGATVGGLLGGAAGSQAGSWVGGQLEDVGAEAGVAVGEGLGWAGEHAGDLGDDVLDTLGFWE